MNRRYAVVTDGVSSEPRMLVGEVLTYKDESLVAYFSHNCNEVILRPPTDTGRNRVQWHDTPEEAVAVARKPLEEKLKALITKFDTLLETTNRERERNQRADSCGDVGPRDVPAGDPG